MTDRSSPSTSPSSSEENTFRAASGAMAALVLIQAALAGRFLNLAPGDRSVHRVLGEFLGLLAVGLCVLGFRLRRSHPTGWWISLAVLALVMAQTGLGFAGRESATAAALHVPVGVLTFGVALVGAAPLRSRS